MYVMLLLGICMGLFAAAAYLIPPDRTLMAYMMLVMLFMSSAGLLAGMWAGTVLPGQLFAATVLSAGGSAAAGLLLGARFHPWAGVEGLCTGLMAAMMGAMLTEMVSPQEGHALLLMGSLWLAVTALYGVIELVESKWGLLQRRFWLLVVIGAAVLAAIYATFPAAKAPVDYPWDTLGW